MLPSPARLTAWLALALIALAALAVEVAPTLNEGVASAASVCAPCVPEATATHASRPSPISVLSAPRCGVA